MEAFFEGLTKNAYESDASKALRDRLLKNRARLFTFLHYAGVSWNNNVAENAIKQFSRYREYVGEMPEQPGLLSTWCF